MIRRSEPRGFALLLGVCLLAVIGGVAAAAAFAIREAQRSASRLAHQESASGTADSALFARIEAWDQRASDSLPVGSIDSAYPSSYVTRVTHSVYAVTAIGNSGREPGAHATRASSLLLEVRRPTVPTAAALTARGNVVVAAGAQPSLGDAVPPEWQDCPAPDTADAVAIVVPFGARAEDETGAAIASVSHDSVAERAATYEILGRVTTKELTERADVHLTAGAVVSPQPPAEGGCNRSGGVSRDSWGEPLRNGASPGCERVFPVVHATGDLVVRGGRGQGVLIVDGRLHVDGPFLYYGLVLARSIEMSGSDVTVYGAVLSGGEGDVSWLASGRLRRSTCALFRASSGAARAYPVRRGGWSEVR